MKIKLVVIGLILVLICPNLSAQKKNKVDTGIHFGILAGASLQTFIGTDYWGEKLSDKLNPGFHGGANITLPLLTDIYFQPGLIFSMKGAKQNVISVDITKTISLYYLEVPLNVVFRPQVGDGHLLIGVGPYAACGLFGKEKTKVSTLTTEIPVKFIADASDQPTTYVYYKRFDAGGNILFGYEFYNGIFFQLDGQLGLMKINSDYGLPNDKTSKMNLGFGISVGYRFF